MVLVDADARDSLGSQIYCLMFSITLEVKTGYFMLIFIVWHC